jgi:hypothetical protein
MGPLVERRGPNARIPSRKHLCEKLLRAPLLSPQPL